jgi:hypothetical protein
MWVKDGKLDVSIKRRGKRQADDHKFVLAVNCTGPLGSISQTSDPLLKSLFEAGSAKPDALDLGLEVDDTVADRGFGPRLGAGTAHQGPLLGNHRGSRYQGPSGASRQRYREGIGPCRAVLKMATWSAARPRWRCRTR